MKYHPDVNMPKQIKNLPDCKIKIDCIKHHAIEQMESDKYGIIQFCDEINFNGKMIVEFESTKNYNKFVIRKRETNEFDSVWVILIDKQTGISTLKTVWLNSVDDNHSTLDKSKYM